MLAAWVVRPAEAAAQIVYTWNSGNIAVNTGSSILPNGATSFNAGDTLNITTSADHDIATNTVVNSGTVNWLAGAGRIRGGGSLTNNGQWNDAASSTINADFGGYSFVNNSGATYLKSSGTTQFAVGFTNSGTISVTGGTLNLAAGGTFNSGSTVGSTGGGVVQLTGGTLTMTGTVATNNFVLNGGTLAGTHTLNGVVNWLAGNLNAAGVTTIANGSTFSISTTVDHDLSARTVVNNGTVNWQAGRLRSGGGGGITNNAVWNDTASHTFNADYGGGASFTNNVGGTYNKISGTSTIDVPFINFGTVTASGGTLSLSNGGTFHDGSVIGSTGAGVAQLTGGVLTAGGNAGFTANNFKLTAGQLSGNMTFLGTTDWVGSNFNTPGTATIGATGTLVIANGADHDFNSHAIVNNGIVNWSDGRLRSGGGGTITNNAAWNDSVANTAVNNDYGGTGGTTFINAVGGNYNKTAGATTMNVPFVNRGTVTVSGGTLSLAAGGTFHDGSVFGSTGSGVAQLTGGVLTASGSAGFTGNNFKLTAGQLSGNMTFLGTTDWVGSNFNAPGTATIGAGATFIISSAADHDFSGHAFVNQGTVNWTGGRLRSGNGGSITNTAAWNDSAASVAFNNDYGGAGGTTFTNAASGTYLKTAGTTTFSTTFVNAGTVSVTGGQLNLSNATFNHGSSIGSSGSGIVQLTAGLLNATGTINTQNFLFNGGSLTGTQTFNGTLSWLTGDWNTAGTMTVGSAGTLTIAGGADHDFAGHAIVNHGVVNWTGGRLRSGSGGTITNHAVWNDSTAGTAINNDYGGAGGTTFINSASGTYNKTGNGTTTVSAALNNQGVINIASGNLSVTGAFTNNGTVAVANGASLSAPPGLAFASGSALRGTGAVSSATMTVAGSVFPGTSTTAGQLTLTGAVSFLPGAAVNFELGGTTPGSQHDHLAVNGALTLGGDLMVRFIGGFNLATTGTMTFDLIGSTALTGAFANVPNGGFLATADGLGTFKVNYGVGSAFAVNHVVLSNFVAVPEPSTWALLLTGLSVVGYTLRRRRRKM